MEKRKKFKRVVPPEINVEDLTIYDVVCGTTKCTDGYHCYSQKKTSLRKYGTERACKECGDELTEWKRIHQNDLSDSTFVFKQLQKEIIRHVFWHTPIELKAIQDCLFQGEIKTKEKAVKLLKTRIGKYNSFMDGRQTPMGKDQIINYAQHATATCCRKCLEAWHNFPMQSVLSDEQLMFCADLIMKYVKKRVPELRKNGLDEQEVEKILKNEHH